MENSRDENRRKTTKPPHGGGFAVLKESGARHICAPVRVAPGKSSLSGGLNMHNHLHYEYEHIMKRLYLFH